MQIGTLVLRGSVDQSDLVHSEPSLEPLLTRFNTDFGPQLLAGEVRSPAVLPTFPL